MIQHKYRHLVFSPNVQGDIFKRHLVITLKGLIYATRCLKPPSMNFVKQKMVDLERNDAEVKKTLVLDLDETLIHTTSFRHNNSHSIILKAKNKKSLQVHTFHPF